MQVALKRIGDVLASPEYAKRVLRECAILRRLRHPNIVGLRDAFLKPAATGRGTHTCLTTLTHRPLVSSILLGL
jgi:serine/threonine protein kinase